MKIGFIGLGNMASAMIGGIIKKGIVMPKEILGSSGTRKSVQKAEEAFGIQGMSSNKEVAGQADILILSVKPGMYEKVISEIKEELREETVLLSIAPGKTMDWISGLLETGGSRKKIVRCMPNTPALVGEDKENVMSILNSFGKAIEVPEHLMDAVVGVSGSSPAYVFLFIEAMADAAVADGIPRKQAYEFAAQAVYGSAKMVLETL